MEKKITSNTAREKIYEQDEVRTQYLEKLNSKDATTFLSDKEADEFDKQLEDALKRIDTEKETTFEFDDFIEDMKKW